MNPDFNLQLDKKVNSTLLVLNSKINALRNALDGEQLKKYNASIEESQKLLQDALAGILNPKELDEVLKMLHK